jgi:hypothetical protein
MFLAVAATFIHLSKPVRFFITTAAIVQAWSMAMYRDVERGFGVLEPILHVFTGGFQIPVLTVASRMEQFRDYFAAGVSPLPLFGLVATLIYGIWIVDGKGFRGPRQ